MIVPALREPASGPATNRAPEHRGDGGLDGSNPGCAAYGPKEEPMDQIDLFATNGSSPPRRFRGYHPGEIDPDFFVSKHGMLFLLAPLTDAARAWGDDHLDLEPAVVRLGPCGRASIRRGGRRGDPG